MNALCHAIVLSVKRAVRAHTAASPVYAVSKAAFLSLWCVSSSPDLEMSSRLGCSWIPDHDIQQLVLMLLQQPNIPCPLHSPWRFLLLAIKGQAWTTCGQGPCPIFLPWYRGDPDSLHYPTRIQQGAPSKVSPYQHLHDRHVAGAIQLAALACHMVLLQFWALGMMMKSTHVAP
jgi:hypothetical protein